MPKVDLKEEEIMPDKVDLDMEEFMNSKNYFKKEEIMPKVDLESKEEIMPDKVDLKEEEIMPNKVDLDMEEFMFGEENEKNEEKEEFSDINEKVKINFEDLTDIQKIYIKENFDLEDNVVYVATLEKIEARETYTQKLPMISMKYSISDIPLSIEDNYIINVKNEKHCLVTMNKIKTFLIKTGINFVLEDFKSVDSIATLCKKAVGLKVKLRQTTNNGYKNYEIVEVIQS